MGRLKEKEVNLLVDSRAMDNFIDLGTVQRVGLDTSIVGSFEVMVAKGEKISSKVL